ncbi:MAG: hypothetical protein JXR81_00165 [Candidatus Goldbacteria bacterium]|nr:hypothetical protein [Candidatus Goldiibacteriota bacterium]
MQIKGEDYSIIFDDKLNTVNFNGSLRLENMGEYKAIEQFLLDVHELNLPFLNLDFKEVDFLNSSGIAMLCRFIMDVKKQNKMPVIVTGNDDILWQKKSFANLKLLWDKVEVKFGRAQ